MDPSATLVEAGWGGISKTGGTGCNFPTEVTKGGKKQRNSDIVTIAASQADQAHHWSLTTAPCCSSQCGLEMGLWADIAPAQSVGKGMWQWGRGEGYGLIHRGCSHPALLPMLSKEQPILSRVCPSQMCLQTTLLQCNGHFSFLLQSIWAKPP